MAQLKTSDELIPINLSGVEMKHLGAKWIVKLYDNFLFNPHLVVNGFVASRITDVISNAIDPSTGTIDNTHFDYSSGDDSEAQFTYVSQDKED